MDKDTIKDKFLTDVNDLPDEELVLDDIKVTVVRSPDMMDMLLKFTGTNSKGREINRSVILKDAVINENIPVEGIVIGIKK